MLLDVCYAFLTNLPVVHASLALSTIPMIAQFASFTVLVLNTDFFITCFTTAYSLPWLRR